jgi:hypothetical protein
MKLNCCLLLLASSVSVANPISCHTDASCKAAMDAARSWIGAHEVLDIRVLTDDFIETYVPRNANPYTFAARVNRVRGTDGSVIELTLSCGAEINKVEGGLIHMKSQPCRPNGDELRDNFVMTVANAIATAER